MKTISKTAIVLLALGASAWMATAQDGSGPPPRGERPPRREGPGGPGGPGRDGQRPPPPPLVAALDANHDGVIDEKEIAHASKALKKLDKNGDGKLTLDELRPPRPEGDLRARGPEGDLRARGPEGRRGPEDRRGPEGRRPGGFDGPRGPGGEGDRPLPPPGGPRDDRPLPPPRDN